MANNEGNYQADGTIQVRLGASDGIKTVTFIPDQYVEQNDSKFVVFLPRDYGTTAKADQYQAVSTTTLARVVKAKEARLRLDGGFADKEALLLQAAVDHIKVTVVVSPSANGGLDLKEVVIPAVPTSPTTR